MRMPEPGCPLRSRRRTMKRSAFRTSRLPGQNLHLIQREETKKEDDEEKKPPQTKPISGQDALIQREEVSGDEEKKKDEETQIQTKSISGQKPIVNSKRSECGNGGRARKERGKKKSPSRPSLLSMQASVNPKKQPPGQMPGHDTRCRSHIAASKGRRRAPPGNRHAPSQEPRFSRRTSASRSPFQRGAGLHSELHNRTRLPAALNAQPFTTGQDIYLLVAGTLPAWRTKQGQSAAGPTS